jgi:hypothetical protein
MAAAAPTRDAKFTFTYVDREFGPLKHKETAEFLSKW